MLPRTLNVKKKSLFVVGALIVLAIISWYSIRVYSQNPIYITQAITSKDNKYLAYGFVDSGGGAAGWCQFNVNIIQLDKTLDVTFFFEGNKRIFSIDSCDEGFELKWSDVTANFSLD